MTVTRKDLKDEDSMGSRGSRNCFLGRRISKGPGEKQRVRSKGTGRNLSRGCVGKG